MTSWTFEREFNFSGEKIEKVWEVLQRRETFIKGQIFPYNVEFDAPSQSGPFLSGELNVHHGPLLSVHGAIGEVTDSYRSLNYFYGSYVLSFRVVRPTQLEFIREGDIIRMRLSAYIAPWFLPIWKLGNRAFWTFFGINFYNKL